MTKRLEEFEYRGIRVFLQREDLNPSGSFKDRGIWPLIEYYLKKEKGKRKKEKFAISSSGNAAISAAYYCKKYNLGLDIFVGEKIPREKLERLENFLKVGTRSRQKRFFRCEPNDPIHSRSKIVLSAPCLINLYQSPTPRRDAFQFSKQTGAQLLSTATDDRCLGGYAAMVKEFPDVLDAIFVPASSGALVVGLYQGYEKKSKIPRFFILQTPEVHPLIEVRKKLWEKTSLAQAISDGIGERRHQIRDIIKKTDGEGLVVTDRYIQKAMQYLNKLAKEQDIRFGYAGNASPNGSLSLAGLFQVIDGKELEIENWKLKIGSKVLCLYTGD